MAVINNSINNQVGASNSGATNTLTVTNSSNTASSSANVLVTVGGATADDPFTTYTVSGTTNWSEGIDNSVTGDPYVLSASTALGTTDVMSATTAGIFSYPLQPCFLAYLATNDDNVTGNSTTYTLGTNTALTIAFDQGSNFTTAGIFTAPVTGKYHFDFSCRLTGSTALSTSTATIVTTARSYINGFTRVASVNDISNQISCIADMTAGDTARFNIVATGNGADTADLVGSANPSTFMSGYLVC